MNFDPVLVNFEICMPLRQYFLYILKINMNYCFAVDDNEGECDEDIIK